MATLDDLGRFALGQPDVEVKDHFGGPAYQVTGRTFALYWRREGRAVLRLPPPRQKLLFEARPETFAPCPVGRGVWSYVTLEALDPGELEALIIVAWRGVASRRLSRSKEDQRPRGATNRTEA